MTRIGIFLFLFSAIVTACGCAGPGRAILEQDHTILSDEELLAYFYRLEEEIDRCERQADRTAIGIGTGFGRRSYGFGIGLSRTVPDCNADDLRQRRVEVRLALKKRGLNP